jgi:hypothetical protein
MYIIEMFSAAVERPWEAARRNNTYISNKLLFKEIPSNYQE